MAESQSPFEYDDTWAYARPPREQDPAKMSTTDMLRAADELRAGPKSDRPADPLRWAKGLLPEENKDLPKPRFVMDPRSISLTNMIRGSIDTAANWLDGVKRPESVKDEDMIGPLGGAGLAAAGMTKPLRGGVSAFIGPGQVERLGLTPGSRGSLEALEKAKELWAKGGTTPEGLGESWAKHGWAPPESFGVKGQPFSWLEMPELRMRDSFADDHLEALAQGRMHTTAKPLGEFFEPNRDLRRLTQAVPELWDATGQIRTSPATSYQGGAAVSNSRAQGLTPQDIAPAPNIFYGTGPDVANAERIMRGHELRGHGTPQWGGTQLSTIEKMMGRDPAITDVPAMGKLQDEAKRTRIERDAKWATDPDYLKTFEARAQSRWIDQIKELREQAGQHAAYFARPEERMARHAQIFDTMERQGKTPFTAERAPGVMSTYGKDAIISDDVFHNIVSNEGVYNLRDLKPRAGYQKPLTLEDLAPFMAK